jgi:hypothetical protein
MKRLLKYLGQKIEDVFVWSSGANKDILSAVPTEKNKYFGIGGTIIFTALMASFAGGYAFFTAFKSVYLSVPFGIFWGMLIFNLDRYIVASFGVGDGKKTISKQEWIEAAPRLAMAIVLGFVISTPLELKLFEKEINAEIDTKISAVQNRIIKSSTQDAQIISMTKERNDLDSAITSRNTILKQKLDDYNQAVKDKNDEWNTGKFSGKPGRGEYYDGLVDKANNAQTDYNATNTNYSNSNSIDYQRIKTLDSKIAEREKDIHSDVENQKTVQAQNDGLLARLTALSSLTSKEWTLSFAKWLITALFIFIEIAPILFKMMTERGPYDDIVDRIKHETKVRQLELQSNINQEINTAVRLHTEKHEHKLNAELQSNKEILEAIAKAQQELAILAIEKWKEEQKQILLNGDLHDTVK